MAGAPDRQQMVEFVWLRHLGVGGITVAVDGSWSAEPDMPSHANLVQADEALFAPTLAELAAAMLAADAPGKRSIVHKEEAWYRFTHRAAPPRFEH